MNYTIPSYIDPLITQDNKLEFEWDDWKTGIPYQDVPTDAVDGLLNATIRAQLAACIGIYEWIVWRFKFFSDNPEPYQIAEAAWCGIVDYRYLYYVEFDRREWMGPSRSPLWCAMTWLIPAIYYKECGNEDIEDGLTYLYRLATHVIPEKYKFKEWLKKCTDRLIDLFPAPEEDPFEDLFEEEDMGGPLIASQCLDISKPYHIIDGESQSKRYLRSVDYNQNPFLNSPEYMKELEFEGKPYVE